VYLLLHVYVLKTIVLLLFQLLLLFVNLLLIRLLFIFCCCREFIQVTAAVWVINMAIPFAGEEAAAATAARATAVAAACLGLDHACVW
jgi:hypothetical protein